MYCSPLQVVRLVTGSGAGEGCPLEVRSMRGFADAKRAGSARRVSTVCMKAMLERWIDRSRKGTLSLAFLP